MQRHQHQGMVEGAVGCLPFDIRHWLSTSGSRLSAALSNASVSSHLFRRILTRSIIIPTILFFVGSLDVLAGARAFAQQRPGEVIQQIERDRREQELQKKEKQEKKPPVVIEEDNREGPSTGQRGTGGPTEKSGANEERNLR